MDEWGRGRDKCGVSLWGKAREAAKKREVRGTIPSGSGKSLADECRAESSKLRADLDEKMGTLLGDEWRGAADGDQERICAEVGREIASIYKAYNEDQKRKAFELGEAAGYKAGYQSGQADIKKQRFEDVEDSQLPEASINNMNESIAKQDGRRKKNKEMQLASIPEEQPEQLQGSMSPQERANLMLIADEKDQARGAAKQASEMGKAKESPDKKVVEELHKAAETSKNVAETNWVKSKRQIRETWPILRDMFTFLRISGPSMAPPPYLLSSFNNMKPCSRFL